jgi:hypothetical protein
MSLPHGWGHDDPGLRISIAAQRPGVNLNILLDGRRDPLSGTSVLSGGPVRLERLHGILLAEGDGSLSTGQTHGTVAATH